MRLIDAETILCATIAYPNRAAKSPLMHNAGFNALDLNFVYLAFEPTDLAGAATAMRALGIRGFSVSKPYKEAILEHLDDIDDTARAIGAVNTVLNDNGVLRGFNSDWIGATRALGEVGSIAGKRAVIVGAGGAARAIAFGMKQLQADVTIYNRTDERARVLASQLGVAHGGGIGQLATLTPEDYDILIQATSVGFHPHTEDSIVPGHIIGSQNTILDVVFNPTETQLLKTARSKGATVVTGIRMLVLQGGFQFELFTGANAPLTVMQRALENALAQ